MVPEAIPPLKSPEYHDAMESVNDDHRDPEHAIRCRICGSLSEPVGTVWGSYSKRNYHLRRCTECSLAFLEDPWLEFDRIYDQRYYEGHGADSMVNYLFELDHPDRTIRGYEWAGIGLLAHELMGGLEGLRWLDYGCGNGGLVRYLNANTQASACGFDEGAIVAAARQRGIPIMSSEELAEHEGSFDVVTAIEVLEHTLEPLVTLRQMRRMLRPGGLLFLTTGNAEPFAEKLTRWSYVKPEVHISYFQPKTLEVAMRDSGFRPERRRRSSAFDEILKYKVLMNLHLRRRNLLTDALPARLIAPAADRLRRVSAQPVGWAE
jgi:2-polyprenyl-3-methyl-5-hydroxy-6-metoxy-1,4-benzoquinol methylase